MKAIEYSDTVWIEADINEIFNIPILKFKNNSYVEYREWFSIKGITALSAKINNYATGEKVCVKIRAKEIDVSKLFNIDKHIRIGVYSDADCEPAFYITIPVE